MTLKTLLLGGFSALALALPATAEDHSADTHAAHAHDAHAHAAHADEAPAEVQTEPYAAAIMIHDAYARSSGPSAKVGAAFFTLMNHGEVNDRLISATTSAAKVVELHTHIDAGNGVMQMRQDEDGFDVAAGDSHALARGGDHVMMMGLTGPFIQGETVELTLTFEQAGDITVTVPIDNERSADDAHAHHH